MKLNMSYEQLDNEYSMLMNVLGASVSKPELLMQVTVFGIFLLLICII